MKITDDLFAYPWTSAWENNCNSFYIGAGVNALIDPGLSKFLPDLQKRLLKDGINPDDIKHIILTHSHPDHLEAVKEFLDKDDVKIWMSRAETEFMEEVGKEFYPAFGLKEPEYRVDEYLEEGEITIGGEQFEAYITPGHSPGSVCLYWMGKKALISGDLIFSNNVGRTDFPGGSGELLKESIEKMSTLDIEYLLPGHMEVVAGIDAVRENFELVKRSVFPYL